jgi:hypothetical protein
MGSGSYRLGTPPCWRTTADLSRNACITSGKPAQQQPLPHPYATSRRTKDAQMLPRTFRHTRSRLQRPTFEAVQRNQRAGSESHSAVDGESEQIIARVRHVKLFVRFSSLKLVGNTQSLNGCRVGEAMGRLIRAMPNMLTQKISVQQECGSFLDIQLPQTRQAIAKEKFGGQEWAAGTTIWNLHSP